MELGGRGFEVSVVGQGFLTKTTYECHCSRYLVPSSDRAAQILKILIFLPPFVRNTRRQVAHPARAYLR